MEHLGGGGGIGIVAVSPFRHDPPGVIHPLGMQHVAAPGTIHPHVTGTVTDAENQVTIGSKLDVSDVGLRRCRKLILQEVGPWLPGHIAPIGEVNPQDLAHVGTIGTGAIHGSSQAAGERGVLSGVHNAMEHPSIANPEAERASIGCPWLGRGTMGEGSHGMAVLQGEPIDPAVLQVDREEGG